MRTTAEEQQWLAFRWPYFRDVIRVIAVRHSEAVIAEIVADGAASDASWNAFVAAILKDFDARRQGRDALFSTALSLFADPAPLRQCLEQASAIIGGDKAVAVRTVAFKRGLTRMRDAYIGGTEHRGKTWGRLDAISRALARDDDGRTSHAAGRCTMDHFIDLLAYIRERHATDRNLPRTLESIEEYFHEFCADCGTAEIGEDGDPGLPPPSFVEVLPDLEGQAINLAECLEELEDEQRRFVDVNFKMGDPVEFSVAGFCQRLSIERRRFYRVLDRALEALRDCLTAKASDSFGGPSGYRSSWDEI